MFIVVSLLWSAAGSVMTAAARARAASPASPPGGGISGRASAAGAGAWPRARPPGRCAAIALHDGRGARPPPGASCRAFSKCWPSCSNSGLLRSSYSSVTTRSSAPLSLASAMRRWNSAVAADRHHAARDVGFHQRHRLAQARRATAGICAARGQRGQLAFDQLARADDLERAERGVDAARAARPARARRRRCPSPCAPRPGPRPRARSAPRAPTAATRRAASPGRARAAGASRRAYSPARISAAQLVGDLAVQAARFDAVQRHRILVKWSGHLGQIIGSASGAVRRCKPSDLPQPARERAGLSAR